MVWSEIKKNLHVPFFLLAVAGIIGICLLGTGYEAADGKTYTILQLICFGWQSQEVVPIELNQWNIWKAGQGDWFFLVFPVFVSLGAVLTLYEERCSGQVRFQLIRCGYKQYRRAKVAAWGLSGGLVAVVAYILFGVCVLIFFPSLQDFSKELQRDYMRTYIPQGVVLFFVQQIAGMFLYGCLISAISGCICALCHDRYFILCMPVLLVYFFHQSLLKISFAVQGDNVIRRMIDVMQPESMLSVGNYSAWQTGVQLLMLLTLYGLFDGLLALRGKLQTEPGA